MTIVLLSTTSATRTLSVLDSPAKIQRSRAAAAAAALANASTTPSTSSSTLDNDDVAPDQLQQQDKAQNTIDYNNHNNISSTRLRIIERVRRTQPQHMIGHRSGVGVSSGSSSAEACPPTKLLVSLLAPSLVSSGSYCDCNADLMGWHVTCFASDAFGPADHNSMMHPAFSSQLNRNTAGANNQRSGGASSSGNGGRLHKRSAVQPLNTDRADQQQSAGSAHQASQAGNDESVHEGFGEEPALAASSSLPAGASSLSSPADDRHQQVGSSTAASADGSPTTATSNRTTTTTAANMNMNDPMFHLQAFHTVPTLFSIRYQRNSVIEIDCDNATPHYKPAMFQGKYHY